MDGRRLPVFPYQDRLEKRTTRQFRGTLFSSLLNLWLFDRRASAPDRGNHLTFAPLLRDEDPHQRLWPLVMETCPLLHLQHWREPVMKVLTQHQMMTALHRAIGNVCAWRLTLRVKCSCTPGSPVDAPLARAAVSPAWTPSRINSRLNSASEANRLNTALGVGCL